MVNPQLTNGLVSFFGGHLLTQVEVNPVFYGQVSNASLITDFYKGVVDSLYVDWLSEYSTSDKIIKHGTAVDPVFVSAINQTVTTGQIEQLLKGLMDTNIIRPNDQSYFPVHLSSDTLLVHKQSGETFEQCVDFCSFHNSFFHNNQSVFFAVVPDMTGCLRCGSSGDFGNVCALASRELVNTITDPGVGFKDSRGWVDDNGFEITDLCQHDHGSVEFGGRLWTVQKAYSGQLNQCIVNKQPLGTQTLAVPVTVTRNAVILTQTLTLTVTDTALAQTSLSTSVSMITSFTTIFVDPTPTDASLTLTIPVATQTDVSLTATDVTETATVTDAPAESNIASIPSDTDFSQPTPDTVPVLGATGTALLSTAQTMSPVLIALLALL
ncbi:hypothetical protein EDD86DRAFT_203557 [Gorgonomyces haynaldii]|nr:hypothetical protein EDD86DRAFT_203557 [Gorgonomyces haynaldii]